ncbi:MAG: N-acetylmuramoyl-L-alanine amidase [bacterium]
MGRDIAKNIYKLLKRNNYNALLAQEENSQIPYEQKIELAKQLEACMVISLSINAPSLKSLITKAQNQESTISTINTLYPGSATPQATNLSQNLANELNKSFISNMQETQNIVRYLGKKQLEPVIFPTSQTDIAFVSLDIEIHKNNITQAENKFFQVQFAQNIYAGICQYLASQQ